LVAGHLNGQGLEELNNFLGTKPASGCSGPRIGFQTCASDWLTAQVPEDNRFPLPDKLWGKGVDEKISKEDLDWSNNNKKQLDNLKDLPDLDEDNAHYGYISGSDVIELANHAKKTACQGKNDCCSKVKVTFKCDAWLSKQIDEHIRAFKGTGERVFDGASNPCGKTITVKCDGSKQ
jgi:hypothetical protein